MLLHLAEPLFLQGHVEEAKKTLAQVKLLDARLTEKVDEIAKNTLGEPVPESTDGEAGLNILGISSAMVIDPDDAVGMGVEDILRKLGVPNIARFNDGETAWQSLSDGPEPGLIILEWRIPKLSGPLLIQRIRQLGFLNVPIIVLSSLLKPEDMPLVREIGVANIVNKPLNSELFLPALIGTMQQERLPTEHQTLERKIRHLLKARKLDEAEPLKAQILGDQSVPLARKRLIEAEYAYATSDYVLARDAALDALRLAGDGILVLNVLGKAFMRLKDFEAALKCFKKAQELSPHNIERLCNIAEATTETGDHEAAQEALGSAQTLDPDATLVTEAEVRVAIAKGDTAGAKKIMGEIESLDSLVAYMNNKAVAFAKCGHPDDAVALYHKTMESIPDDRIEIRAIVTYNLALAMARNGDLEGANQKLTEVLRLKVAKIEKKAHSLKERIKSSLDNGTDFKLKSADTQDAPKPEVIKETATLSSDDDYRSMLASVEAKRGDICCYLIFHNQDAMADKTKALFANPPRYKARDAIARAETLGSERLAKVPA